MNRSADLSQAEDAERHSEQRKKPGQAPLVSYRPQAAQQSRPFDSDERFDADEPYDPYEYAAFRRGRIRTPSSRAFLFVMLTALNTTVASILSVVITLGVVRRERPDVRPQDAPVVVRSESTTPHAAIKRINLRPISSPNQPLRLEPHKPAQLSLQIEPEAAANEPFILALSNAPAGTMLSGATQISSDTWFLSPGSADRLEIALPEWSTSVFEITLVLRHTDGLVAAQTTAWIAVPPPEGRLPADANMGEATSNDLVAQAEMGDASAAGRSVAASQVPAPAAPAAPRPGETFRDCADCPEMVVVPAGEFIMGSGETAYERPKHKVVIANPFGIGRREITFEEWDRCFAAGGCKYSPDDHGWGRGQRPVIDISWDDAKEFLNWLSQTTKQPYRLPSEAEWEYAARAGTTSPFWWGRSMTGNAVCEDCSSAPPRKTMPIGSIRPNGFGLFDVAGNAAEWVEDCWNESYRGAPKDGSPWIAGQCVQRGLRGGSFASKMNMIRSSARFRYDKDVRYYANGFRVARGLK